MLHGKMTVWKVPALVWSQFRDRVEIVTKGEAAECFRMLGTSVAEQQTSGGQTLERGRFPGSVAKRMRAGVCGSREFVRALNGDEGLIVAYPGGAKEIDCDA
jgi:hypothetical protein